MPKWDLSLPLTLLLYIHATYSSIREYPNLPPGLAPCWCTANNCKWAALCVSVQKIVNFFGTFDLSQAIYLELLRSPMSISICLCTLDSLLALCWMHFDPDLHNRCIYTLASNVCTVASSAMRHGQYERKRYHLSTTICIHAPGQL